MAKDEDGWEYEKTEDSEEDEAEVVTYQISYYPADITLRGYLDKCKDDQLIIPPFQREYIWDQVKASKLIESFLLGLPVPGVFLYKERGTNKLLVIDGQQRILSVVRFFKNEFDERIFRLKKVLPKWDGKTFDELDESDRFQINDAVLRATVIQQLDPADDSSIYQIFERLNTGGINLNPMEIRKCVSFGPFFTLLDDLNQDPNWRVILGKPKRDKRLRDVELILRVFALLDWWRKYEKPMKQFLNHYMESMKKLGEKEREQKLESLRGRFCNACEFVVKELGEKPFHLRSRLNYAVLDSIMVSTMVALENGEFKIKRQFEKLLKEKDYIESVSTDTSDAKVIETRFEKAHAYFGG